MIRSELVATTARYTGMDPATVNTVLRGMADVIAATLARGEAVTVSGLAKFTGRLERQSPATSTDLHRVVHITPSSTLTAIVGGARPAPTVPHLAEEQGTSAAGPAVGKRTGGAAKRLSPAKTPTSRAGSVRKKGSPRG